MFNIFGKNVNPAKKASTLSSLNTSLWFFSYTRLLQTQRYICLRECKCLWIRLGNLVVLSFEVFAENLLYLSQKSLCWRLSFEKFNKGLQWCLKTLTWRGIFATVDFFMKMIGNLLWVSLYTVSNAIRVISILIFKYWVL